MQCIVTSGSLLYNKRITLIKVQSFQQRQAVCRSSEIKRELLRSKTLTLCQALGVMDFLETAQ